MSTTGTGRKPTVWSGPEASSPNSSLISPSSTAKLTSSSRPRSSTGLTARPMLISGKAKSSPATSSASACHGKARPRIPTGKSTDPSKSHIFPLRMPTRTRKLRSLLRITAPWVRD
uniref:Uncharacterized protein MANES_09G037400 n=1 Tax=Rhizophora mucronata TaxID=61149 RepID=A0A2P2IKN9_RHIMU